MALLLVLLQIVCILAIAHSIRFQAEPREKQCTVPGPMCNSCDQLVTCVKSEDEFLKLPLETCDSDQTCLGAQCTSDRNPKCEEEPEFPCNDVGVFPNPFDCQAYHFCVQDDSGSLRNYKTRCDGSFGYHAGSTFCQIRLENNVCFESVSQFPVDLCVFSGQTAALSKNPSIYYICAQYSESNPVLYPFLFVCPHGGVYYNYECALILRRNLEKLTGRF